MAKLALIYEGQKAGRTLERNMRQASRDVNRSMKDTAHRAQQEILVRGRENIASSGNFRGRWTSGLRAHVTGRRGDYTIKVFHVIPYAWVFQTGAIIRGRPLLWVPLGNNPPIRKYPGQLYFRRSRKGTPLAWDKDTGEPEYVGKTQVKLRKRWRIIEICRETAARLKAMYSEEWNKRSK